MRQISEALRHRPSRRDIMLGAGASALLTAQSGSAAGHVAWARGFVFEDRSCTGRRQQGDPGIPDVLVSNGKDVVRTGLDGSWSLPVAEGDHLFVVKPSHWPTPVGEGGVPQFSRLYQPSGSPKNIDYHYPTVRPTGPLPALVEFPLRRVSETARFDAILLTDSQPENAAELQYFREDILGGVIAADCVFGTHHGDVMFDNLSLYDSYLRLLGATGIPWHHSPGNHDINFEASSDRYSRETWKRTFGPRHYAFQYASTTFIMLDNVYYFGRNPGSAHSGHYRGFIGRDQLQFVHNLLTHVPDESLVVLSMHIPLMNSQSPVDPEHSTADYRALLALLAGRPHTVSFAGHMHTTEHHYLSASEGFAGPGDHHHHILTAASGSWWSGPKNRRGIPLADSPDGTPNGFHVLSVDGNRYMTRFVPAVDKSGGQMRIVIDGPEIVVNVFDGGPRTRVTFDVFGQNSGPISMRRASSSDPLIVRLFAEHAAACKSWVRPVACSHIWKAPIPNHLKPGAHRLTVRACDEYGRVHIGHTVLEWGEDVQSPA